MPTSEIEIFPAKVFTRDNPCTKVDLWNCFHVVGETKMPEFRSVPVVTARGVIGENAPKYLLKNGYAVVSSDARMDSYDLTRAGKEWLIKGLQRHLELHPEDLPRVRQLPEGWGGALAVKPTRVVRVSRTSASPTVKRITRRA